MGYLTRKKAGGNTESVFPKWVLYSYNIMKDGILYKIETKFEICLVLGEFALIYDGENDLLLHYNAILGQFCRLQI